MIKIKILQHDVTRGTYGATLNVPYFLKPMKNWEIMIYLLGIAPFYQKFAFLRLKDKELKMFLSSHTTDQIILSTNEKSFLNQLIK